jgi:hypothetical protein
MVALLELNIRFHELPHPGVSIFIMAANANTDSGVNANGIPGRRQQFSALLNGRRRLAGIAL